MVFSMSPEAKRYFNKLNESKHGKLDIQFDFYYLCLLAGLKNVSRVQKSGDEVIDQFPKLYAMHREQIIGLVITTQIRRDKIDVENRGRLERLMLSLVKPDSPSKLSSEGENVMNQYAESGFQYIITRIPLPPSRLDTFLVQYYEKILNEPVTNDEE